MFTQWVFLLKITVVTERESRSCVEYNNQFQFEIYPHLLVFILWWEVSKAYEYWQSRTSMKIIYDWTLDKKKDLDNKKHWSIGLIRFWKEGGELFVLGFKITYICVTFLFSISLFWELFLIALDCVWIATVIRRNARLGIARTLHLKNLKIFAERATVFDCRLNRSHLTISHYKFIALQMF